MVTVTLFAMVVSLLVRVLRTNVPNVPLIFMLIARRPRMSLTRGNDDNNGSAFTKKP